jgi:hypothetical protein
MDFTAMGAFGFFRMKEAWQWIDITAQPYPRDRVNTYWSHPGISDKRRKKLEALLA